MAANIPLNPFCPAEASKQGRQASADIASATTINLEDADGDQVDVTGTTTITGIILYPGHTRRVRFTGALSITYGATTIVTPGAHDLGVSAGDIVTFIGDSDSVVRVLDVYRISGGALAAEVVAATRTLTLAENGKTIFLNHATEFATTLPALQLGLRFTFIVAAAPSGANYTIVAPAATIKGHVLTTDVNSATDPDFGTTGEATITFVAAKAVAGDMVDLWCDGVNWFMRASCSLFDAITLS